MEKGNIDKKLIVRAETTLKKQSWNILATSKTKKGRDLISEILEKFNIKDISYHPNLLIEKEGYKVFLIFSEKSKFPISKAGGEIKIVSGIDWFKYKLCQYIEATTKIQVGLIMHSKESNELIIRQLNQLTKPTIWFPTEGCLLNQLKSQYRNPSEKKKKKLERVYEDPKIEDSELKEIEEINKQLKIEQYSIEEYNPLPFLECIKCYQRFPKTSFRCMKGKHKRIKVFAIWNVNEFEQKKLSIQKSLLN